MLKNLIILMIASTLSHAGVYQDLEFGDSKQTVLQKLKTSAQMTPNVPTDMVDLNTDINGIFEIKTPLKGSSFSLHFGWSESNTLKNITLRSAPVSLKKYKTTLSSTFEAALQLITEIHGTPLMANPMPQPDQINQGKALHSHLWPNDTGTILMGIAKQGDSYQVSVSFTEKEIRP